MNKLWLALPVLFASAVCAHRAPAQTTSGTPNQITAVCNDGSNWSRASRSGACRGHKGVKTWNSPAQGGGFAQPNQSAPSKGISSETAGPTNTKPGVTPAQAATSGATNVRPAIPGTNSVPSPSPKEQASGVGQPNQVWVNTETKVYHCPGDRYYGKTKQGKFMTEAQAQSAGMKPDHGQACANRKK